MRILPILLFTLLLASAHTLGQSNNSLRNSSIVSNDDDDDPFYKKGYFMAGVNYLSDNTYLGRKDTLAIPYYSPYIGYHLKNGLYAKAMTSFTSTDGWHNDLTTFEAGWDHSFGDFNAGINAEKFYYNKNSLSVRSSTDAGIGVDAQYNNDALEPQVIFDLNFNKSGSLDKVLGLALDHNFDFMDHTLNIAPAVIINSGTQHYYDDFYINRLKKQDKTHNKKFSNIVANADKLQTLDYEFRVKTTYRRGHWFYTFIPTYAIPTNPATINLSKKQHFTEKITNSFYVELDVCHR